MAIVSASRNDSDRWRRNRLSHKAREAVILAFLFLCAVLSVITTVGIVVTLLTEAIPFFGEVSLVSFLTGTVWAPLFAEKHFGALPLLSATALIAALALSVAFPVGLLTALYLSEYAHETVRAVVKPVLEVLAGIPTVVYGFLRHNLHRAKHRAAHLRRRDHLHGVGGVAGDGHNADSDGGVA